MSPTRRQFLHASAATLASAAFWPGPTLGQNAASDRRPNVLWIGVDDLRCGLGCYGADHIHSPHIDALADRGMRFDRAYVQQAVCAASRASFLTGCRPETTTVDYPYNDYFTGQFLRTHPTLPRHLHDVGYHCRGLGKIHHGPPLDLSVFPEPYYTGEQGTGGYVLPENRDAKGQDRPPTEMADVPDDAYRDGQLAVEAERTIRRWAGMNEPWCLTVGFYKPHLPFCAPKRYWDLYDREALPLTPTPERPADAPFYATATFELPTYAGRLGSDENPIDEDEARLLRHGYFACTSYVDACIGRVLRALDESGQRDHTIVMLWSDHGWHLGDQGAWGKHMNYEQATRAPLIVDAPGMPAAQRGRASDALVEYVDMFPTICELAGVQAPDYLEGTSFTPLLERPDRPWKTAAFSQYPRWGQVEGFAIRTDRYRYVEWQRTGEGVKEYWAGPEGSVHARELYDHRTDPHESTSLADDPEHQSTVERLSEQLRAGWQAALPPST